MTKEETEALGRDYAEKKITREKRELLKKELAVKKAAKIVQK